VKSDPSSGLLGGKIGQGGTAKRPLGARGLRMLDYLEAPLHHPWWLLVPLVLTFASATAAALLLPKRYNASSLVLIKASGVPDKIIASVGQELDARRHQTIRQEILSRTRLERVNEDLHPYPDTATATAAVEALRGSIEVTMRGADAFTVSFTHRDPALARDVTNRITSLFIEEFRRSKQNQFEGAAEFLDEELDEARRQLDAKEEALRKYKERNLGRLPEQLEATLSTLQRLQQESQSLDLNVEAAEARLERATSRGGADRAAPAPETGPSEVEQLEQQLAQLRLRYTDEHPDVQALRARLQGLRRTPASTPAGSASNETDHVARARADVNALLARRQEIRGQIAALQASVDHMPRTEQELATLTRDFNQLRESYQAVLRRKMDAKMAGRLQQRWTEDFEVLDEARLPERHVFPNRPLFVVGGLLVGLLLGVGAALLAEILSPYVLNLEDLEATVPVPVLAVLPVVDRQESDLAVRYLASRRGPSDRGRPS
jgi:succinoglycan biosynthesis transport protein ExoP